MDADTSIQLLIAIATLVTALATFITLFYLKRQMRMQTDQMRIQTVSTNSQVYQNFVNNSLEIDRMLIQYPQFRKYVYGNDPLSKNDPDYDLIMGIEKLVVDVVENIKVFENEIPAKYIDGWMNFVKDVESSSAYE